MFGFEIDAITQNGLCHIIDTSAANIAGKFYSPFLKSGTGGFNASGTVTSYTPSS